MKYWKKMVALALAIPMVGALTMSASAMALPKQRHSPGDLAMARSDSGPEPFAKYDFTDESTKDSTGNNGDISLCNGASIGKFGDRGNKEGLNLRNDSKDSKEYASLPDELFKKIGDDVTIDFAAKSRHGDDGKHFSFSIGKDDSHYFFVYLSNASVKLAIADNGWRHEISFKKPVDRNENQWHNYRVIVKGDSFALLRDRQFVAAESNTGIKLSDLGGTQAYIGKSFYNEDLYWNGALADLTIYKGADLKLPDSVSIDGEGVVDNSLELTEGESRQLKAVVKPEDAISTDVTWSSLDSSIASVDPKGTITALKSGSVDIKATTKAGDVSSTLKLTVEPADPQTAAKEDLDAVLSSLTKSPATENLPLLAHGSGHGSDIVWSSSDPGLISPTNTSYQRPAQAAADPYQGAGKVVRPPYGSGDSKPVRLTGTASNDGAEVTKSVEIVLKEQSRTAPDNGYAAVTFLSDKDTEKGKIGEALYESATSTEENNFFSFTPINNADPVITSHTDTTGLRDPFVLKSHNGDKYYMIATDLKVSKQGWGQNQQYGSLKLEVWESSDMVNWTRTNAEDGSDSGIVVNSANQGMTWAPEAFWDDSLNAYVVFFSSRAYTDNSRTKAIDGKNGTPYNIVRYAITRDFKSFTPAQDWQNTGYSRIDSSVFKIGDYFYRMTKNEENGKAGDWIATGKTVFLERSQCLTCTTTSADPQGDEKTTWRLLDENLLPFEGPESIGLNKDDINQNDQGDAMVLMADSGGYQPFMTSGSDLFKTNWNNRLSKTPGWFDTKPAGKNITGRVKDKGMPDPKRHGAFVSVPQNVLEVMHRYTSQNKATIQPVDSTTTASYDNQSRKLVVGVKASDGGVVAGEVTVAPSPANKGQTWSATVKLDSKQGAVLSVPNTVSGDLIVNYEGYTDHLVKQSTTTVHGVSEATSDSGRGQAADENQDLSKTGSAVGLVSLLLLLASALAIVLAGIRHRYLKS